MKGEPSQKSVKESFNKVVPAINPFPQNKLNVEEIIKGNQKNGFKMGLVRGNDGDTSDFFEGNCPYGWYRNKVQFKATGTGLSVNNCKQTKDSKADAFTTINNGRIGGVHIRHGGKYGSPPKVIIKSVDGKGNGARGKAILDKVV